MSEKTSIPHAHLLEIYHIPSPYVHYLVHDLFRILRPLRWKYKLTINEIVVLNAIYVYGRHESTEFTKGGIRQYVGYFNDSKITYYLKTLEEKGCITVCSIVRDSNRYSITQHGIEVIESMPEAYETSLRRFLEKNHIEL